MAKKTINLLPNGGFENGWVNMLPYGGKQTNQCPLGFNVYVRMPGTRLVSADSYDGLDEDPVYDRVRVVPEVVHKHRSQMPDADQRIREGDWCLKIFSGTSPHSSDVTAQVVIPVDGVLHIQAPVEVHAHGDGSVGAAVWRLIVDDNEHPWRTFGDGFNDREYAVAEHIVGVTQGQVVTATAQLESRALGGIDFFTDGWRMDLTFDAETADYVIVVELLPQDATKEEVRHVLNETYEQRRSILYSDQDATSLVMAGLPGSHIRVWSPERWTHGDIVQVLHDRGVADVLTAEFPGSTPPVVEPPVTPAPTPSPGWQPRNYTPTGTRLSWHAVGDAGLVSDDPDDPTPFRRIYAAGQTAPGIKHVTDLGAGRWLTQVYTRPNGQVVQPLAPEMPIVGRIIDSAAGNLEWFDSKMDPYAQAEVRMNHLKPFIDANPWVDYWEIVNEQDPATPEGHAQLGRFTIRAAEIAEAWGTRIAGFSYSVGVPEIRGIDEWAPIAETGVFERLAAGGHALSLHEYDIMPNIGDTLCRYRYVYEHHILPRQLDIPLIITEYAPVAWQPQLDGWTPEALWAQAVAYDRELRKDPYVLMANIFSVGNVGWRRFHKLYVQTYDDYVNYAIAEGSVANAS